jgi:hypothetical protein
MPPTALSFTGEFAAPDDVRNGSLRNTLSRSQLQGFVGMPFD